MDEDTSVATIRLLESRLRRLEHALFGCAAGDIEAPPQPTVDSLADLEHRFASLVSGARVYAELLKIYRAHPSLFQAPPPGVLPTQLDIEAIRATVLSYASAFPSTASALNAAIQDTPIPETSLSAHLVALVPRMERIASTQQDLETETASLRSRSERLMRSHYENQTLAPSKFMANVEARVKRTEGRVRRLEKEHNASAEGV